jgi:hypothetical protein
LIIQIPILSDFKLVEETAAISPFLKSQSEFHLASLLKRTAKDCDGEIKSDE